MPVYTSGWRRGLPAPLKRAGSRGPQSVRHWFGAPRDASNFVRHRVPILGHIYVHRKVAEAFEAVFRDIEQAGLAALIDRSDYGGTYCCRRVRGGRSYSPHAWAIAIDLNIHHLQGPQGEYRADRLNWRCRPEEIPDSLQRLWPFFLRWGFTWGGIWRSFRDPMHFEATEITVALLEGRELPVMTAWRQRLKEEGMEPAERAGIKLATVEGKLVTDEVRLQGGRAWMPVRALENLGFEVLAHHLKDQHKIYLHRSERRA